MKIKEHLVIFLIIILFNFSQYSLSKTSELSNLATTYIKNHNSFANSKPYDLKSKSYDLKLIVLRDIDQPLRSIAKTYNVEVSMEPHMISLKNKKIPYNKQNL